MRAFFSNKSILILLLVVFGSTVMVLSSSNELDFMDDGRPIVPEEYLVSNFNVYGNLKKDKKSKDDIPPWEQYDFYLLSLSWSDSYCRSNSSPASCYSKLNKLKDHRILRLHGLWPSKKSGDYIPTCNQGPQIRVEHHEEEPYLTMNEIWPSLNDKGFDWFWTHEYNKHGYCYTQKIGAASYKPYFQKGVDLYHQLDAFNLINKALGGKAGDKIDLSYNELENKLNGILGSTFFEFDCIFKNGEKLLNEVRFYLDMDFKRMDGFRQRSDCDDDAKPITLYFEYDNN